MNSATRVQPAVVVKWEAFLLCTQDDSTSNLGPSPTIPSVKFITALGSGVKRQDGTANQDTKFPSTSSSLFTIQSINQCHAVEVIDRLVKQAINK
jgi:hypothetical protein